MAAHRAEWRSAKHANDWVFSLQAYAHPFLGTLPVRAITTALVMRVIEPFWTTKAKPRHVCVGVSRPFSIGPRCVAIATATTRRV